MSNEPVSSAIEFPASKEFVGRRLELGALRAALEETLSSRGHVMMLVGEPGIGKTRTAEEISSIAQSLDFQVYWGRCYEEEGAPPYWPWVQPLRSHIRQTDANVLADEMGPAAPSIAEIVPELSNKLPGLEPPPPLDPERSRFRLFDAITTFWGGVSQARPLMLVLDDLHWADQSSLLLLEFVAQSLHSLPLLVLGAYRDLGPASQHPLYECLGNLIREPSFARFRLHGLTLQEVALLGSITTGKDLPPALVERIYARTEGNPLFVREVVRMLEGEETSDWQEHIVAIPEGVRDAIRRRLSPLSEGCTHFLTTASVIGREFESRLLASAFPETSAEQRLAFIDEALDARLIEKLPGTPIRWQFSHALIQETLVQDQPTVQRVQLHARIAQALEELHSPDASEHAAELAYHFGEAQPLQSPEKLVYYSRIAGERSLSAHSYDEALNYFRNALAAKGGKPVDAETAELLFGLARAQLATLPRPQLKEAIPNLSAAFDYYYETGEESRAVAIAQYPLPPAPGLFKETTRVIHRALTLVPPDSRQSVALLSRYVRCLTETGDYQGAQQAILRQLDIAQRERDLTLEMQALASAIGLEVAWFQYRDSLTKSQRAIELAALKQDPRTEIYVRQQAIFALLGIGDLNGAREHAAVMLTLGERLGDRNRWATSCFVNLLISCYVGDWRKAREFGDLGLEVEPSDPRLLGLRAIVEYETGEDGDSFIDRLLLAMSRVGPSDSWEYVYPAWVIPLVARITGNTDSIEVARKAGDSLVSLAPDYLTLATMARTGLALIAVGEEDPVASGQQYQNLKLLQGIMQRHVPISGDRVLGLLARTAGDRDEVEAHFQGAMDFCKTAGYRPELAWTYFDYAEFLLNRGRTGDQIQAATLLEKALDVSRDLGMKPLIAKAVSKLDEIEPKASASDASLRPNPGGLTEREMAVLRLIAEGKTNPQIAETLVISPNTVAFFVKGILSKTGCANRTDAATYAIRHGLA